MFILEVKNKKKKINEGTRATRTWTSTGLKVLQETLAYEEQKVLISSHRLSKYILRFLVDQVGTE